MSFHACVWIDQRQAKIFRIGAMTAVEVALGGYRAMHAGRVVAVHGLKNMLGVWSVRFTPRAVVRMLVARLNAVPDAAKQLKA